MAIEKRADYPSEWATFTGVAKLFGMSPKHSGPGSAETKSIMALGSVSPPTSVLA